MHQTYCERQVTPGAQKNRGSDAAYKWNPVRNWSSLQLTGRFGHEVCGPFGGGHRCGVLGHNGGTRRCCRDGRAWWIWRSRIWAWFGRARWWACLARLRLGKCSGAFSRSFDRSFHRTFFRSSWERRQLCAARCDRSACKAQSNPAAEFEFRSTAKAPRIAPETTGSSCDRVLSSSAAFWFWRVSGLRISRERFLWGKRLQLF